MYHTDDNNGCDLQYLCHSHVLSLILRRELSSEHISSISIEQYNIFTVRICIENTCSPVFKIRLGPKN